MRKKLKLFVWEGVLTDWTDGAMWALAYDAAHARQLLLEKCSYLPKEDLDVEPTVHETPCAFYVYGGG